MDSTTHIHFAYRLLKVSGGHSGALICSLYPQVDREPAYYHRLYAHTFFQIPLLIDVGEEVVRSGRIPARYKKNWAFLRFFQERKRFLSYAGGYTKATGDAIDPGAPDRLSSVLAYTSHIYQDTYNNPVQAFQPREVGACAQWGVWEKVNSVGFRFNLYRPQNISAFRQQVFRGKLWDRQQSAQSLIYAMIRRTAAASAKRLDPALVEEAYRRLKVGARPSGREVKEAEGTLVEMEQRMNRLIIRYGNAKPAVPADQLPPIPKK